LADSAKIKGDYMKIGQLYNLSSFERLEATAKTTGFADKMTQFSDSFGGMTLARDLTMVDPRVFEKKYPDLTFVNSGIEVDNTGGFAAQVQSLRLQELGGFADSTDESSNKGKISLTMEDSFLKVKKRSAHSEWSDDEVKGAAMRNVNLVSDFVAAHNKIYQHEIDLAGYQGIAGNEGLLNFSGFNSTSAGKTAATGTPQENYDEIAALITDQWNGVLNTADYKANHVDIPTSVYNTIAKQMLNTANGSSTVLKALQDNFAGVTFSGTNRAEAANNGGTSVTVAYNNTRESMVFRIPQALTVGEIVKATSFDYRVDSKYRVAGLDVMEDGAGRLLTGL